MEEGEGINITSFTGHGLSALQVASYCPGLRNNLSCHEPIKETGRVMEGVKMMILMRINGRWNLLVP